MNYKKVQVFIGKVLMLVGICMVTAKLLMALGWLGGIGFVVLLAGLYLGALDEEYL